MNGAAVPGHPTSEDPREAGRSLGPGVRSALLAAARDGLNVQAGLATSVLARGVLPRLAPLAREWPTLLLLGSTGGALWAAIGDCDLAGRADPIDTFAVEVLERLMAGLAPLPVKRLWPGGEPFPVELVARAAGLAHRSPLGLGIHPRHGLWVGYRGALLVGAAWEPFGAEEAPSPCAGCPDRPCITACPVAAVGGDDGLEVAACFTERLRPGARCGSTCLSRLACPVGLDSRYSDAQVQHHQRSGNLTAGPIMLGAAPGRTPKAWRAR